MSDEKFMQAMAEAMKRNEDRFVERGFAHRHVENSATGISHFILNQDGIRLADLVRRFFGRKEQSGTPIPPEDCIAFVYLLIPPTGGGNPR